MEPGPVSTPTYLAPLTPPKPLSSGLGANGGGRPQPHRYLRETVYKLADDSNRSLEAHPPTAANTCAACGCCVPAWQRAFHQEAMTCVEAMKSVVSTASLTHFASKFDDWRKVDLKATAQLQLHVKELTRISEVMDQFLSESFTSGNICSLKSSLEALDKRSEEMAEARRALGPAIEAAAEKAASKVIDAWSSSVSEQRELLSNFIEEQRLQWCHNSLNWTRLHDGMSSANGNMAKMNASLEEQAEKVAALTIASNDAVLRSEALLNAAAERVERCSASASQLLARDVREGNAADLKSMGRKLEELFSDAGKAGRLFSDVMDNVKRLQKTADQEATEWKSKATSLDKEVVSLRAVADTVRFTQASLAESQKEATDLKCKVNDLSSDLAMNTAKLEAARSVSMNRGLRRVKEVEDKGMITMDRSSGEIAIKAPFEFSPVKPGPKDDVPPDPAFVSTEAIDTILENVLDLSRVFESPLQVEVQCVVGKGGTPAFWEKLAAARAALVRSRLETLGPPPGGLEATGIILKGAKGNGSVVMKLDPSLFRAATPAPKAAPKKK
mmetsp:Transcript_31247/g.66320  ORF Transcript_31247/g.66320 Transcript_31247/m.66320 type:complete len:557 (+) Transcript_31247:48-1718(+)